MRCPGRALMTHGRPAGATARSATSQPSDDDDDDDDDDSGSHTQPGDIQVVGCYRAGRGLGWITPSMDWAGLG